MKLVDAVHLLRRRGAVEFRISNARVCPGSVFGYGPGPPSSIVSTQLALMSSLLVLLPFSGMSSVSRALVSPSTREAARTLELRLDERPRHRVHQGQETRRRQPHPVPAVLGQLLQDRQIGRAGFQDQAPDRQLRQRVGGG